MSELEGQLALLQVQLAELTARVNRHSANSSRPPSADPPSAPPRPPATPSGRKRGGQPGHKGTTRFFVPTATVDQVVPVYPAACAHCRATLSAGSEAGVPWRHQVHELPPIQLQVTEYQLHARQCPHCRKTTRAALPSGTPTRQEGCRLQAFTALLTGRHHVSRRQTQELLADLLGRTLSLGTLSALEADLAEALEPAYQEIAAAVAQAPVVNVDETGWREGKRRPYLWTVVSASATLFHIGSRTKATFTGLLPSRHTQIVGSDRYAAYDHLDPARRACCWAHLVRDFQALTERPRAVARLVGQWGLDVADELFALWHTWRSGAQDRAALVQAAVSLQRELWAALRLGEAGDCPKTAGFCQSLLERWEALWTFLHIEGVEPTNNSAERALRPAVLWRKKSSGHQSETGQRFVERLLSVSTTLRQQRRSLLDFLEATLRAGAAGHPPPSVLVAPTG